MYSNRLATREVIAKRASTRSALSSSNAAAVHRHFASVPLFSTCSKRELRLVTKMAVVEPRASGATLVTQGETGTDAYVILQGTCRVLRNGRRVGTIEAGGIVGELSMLNRAPRNATVIAESPLEVAILQQAQFFALLEQSPSISHKLLKSLAARVQELDTRTLS